MNTDYNSKGTKNPYGHLLDKYLDPIRVDREARRQREKEGDGRYGNLLDKAKPDNSTLELMAEMEEGRIERRKQMEEEKRIAALRNQEHIEAARRKEEAHNAEVRGYAESIIEQKRERVRAAEMAEQEKRKAEERQQEMYDRIDGLMKINPELADAYIQAMKKLDVI